MSFCSISAKDYGLFLADEDIKKGVWLEPGRNLEYYILRNGVSQLNFELHLPFSHNSVVPILISI